MLTVVISLRYTAPSGDVIHDRAVKLRQSRRHDVLRVKSSVHRRWSNLVNSFVNITVHIPAASTENLFNGIMVNVCSYLAINSVMIGLWTCLIRQCDRRCQTEMICIHLTTDKQEKNAINSESRTVNCCVPDTPKRLTLNIY